MELVTAEHGRKAATKSLRLSSRTLRESSSYAMGESLRKKCPRSSHADWKPSNELPDPV
jgi:hypothetical protein